MAEVEWQYTTHHYSAPDDVELITQASWGRTTRILPRHVEVVEAPEGTPWAVVSGPIYRLSDGQRSTRWGRVAFDVGPTARRPERSMDKAPEWLRDLVREVAS